MEVWICTRSVPVLMGAYNCMPVHAGGYYFGSVNQERYLTIAMRLRALHMDREMQVYDPALCTQDAWSRFR
jgi:hypothetical protein